MGLRLLTCTVDGTPHRFALSVPGSGAGPWPAVVFLHGSGECGTDGERQARVGLGPAMEARPARWPCVAVMPQKPLVEQRWEDLDALVTAALDAARAEVAIDPDRIALTGVSQGGLGTWALGARHPGRWSCLAPVCGSAHPQADALAARIARLPVWAFHGRWDVVVDPQDTLRMVTAARAARDGAADGVRMTIYPWLGHDCWDAAYGEDELPRWLLSHTRAAR